MNFEKIEQAYDLLLENVQTIQNQLGTNIYDAMIEQNAAYVANQHETDLVVNNNQTLKQLDLTKENGVVPTNSCSSRPIRLNPCSTITSSHQTLSDLSYLF